VNNVGWYGAVSQNIVGYPSSTVVIDYDYAQSSIGVTLTTFDGYPDTATVTGYNAGGGIVDTVSGVSIPDGSTQVPVSLSGPGIVKVEVTSASGYGWAPLIDDHVYSTTSSAYELFEQATIPLASTTNSGGPTLDENTILTNGEGPGMVKGGVVYSCSSSVQWNGKDWFGQNSQNILGNISPFVIDYEYDQTGVSFTLNAFDGYSEIATVTAYDRAGNVLTTVGGIALPDSTEVPVVLTNAGIARVELTGVNFGWSPIMDIHDYVDGPPAFEKFEMHPVSGGGAIYFSDTSLDSNTIESNGFGPNLVETGVTYSSSGGFQWNDAGWFGQPTKTVMSSNNTLMIDYVAQQSNVKFTLNAFDGGYADVANCYAYDTFGNLVDSVLGVSIPDANQVPVTLSGLNIIHVEVVGTLQSWGPLIDNHDYTTEYPLFLDIVGPCPGTNAVSISGGTPGKFCKIMYSTSNAGSVITFGSCTGSWTDLGVPVRALAQNYKFNAAGEVNINRKIPASACGRIYVQVIDNNCRLSNVFAL
jgi:hypothetical protein